MEDLSGASDGPVTTVRLVAVVGVALLLGMTVLWGMSTTGADDTGIQFREVGAEKGIDYTGTADKRATFGNGRAGVYVLDINRDGRPDLLATGNNGPVLYENVGGTFERRTFPEVNITVKSAVVFDYNNDGWEDVLLLPLKGTPTLVENDQGTFVVEQAGFDREVEIGMAATVDDYNSDGCIDVFVAQNGDWRSGPPKKVRIATIEQEYDRKTTESLREQPDNGNSNYLYRGDCSSFERVTDAGIEGTKWSVATSMADLTGDGRPDIHVANDFNNDTLYVNQGNGSFHRVAIAETDRNGMSSELADINRDGRLDVFVTNVHFQRQPLTMRVLPGMSNEGNNLLINHGNATFTSAEEEYGVLDGGWGWASVMADLDNDGDLDLVHTTRNYVLSTGASETTTPPSVWERTSPENFTQVNASRRGFDPSNGKGMARLDFDLDGDQDLIVADDDSRYKLYENLARSADEDGGAYLQLLPTTVDGRPAYGTTVSVTVADRTRTAVVTSKTDFLSQDTRYLHFGLGERDSVTVRVQWPDGTVQTFELDANQRLRLRQGQSPEAVPASGGSSDSEGG